VIVSDTQYKPHLMRRAAQRMLQQNVEGVAIMTSEMSPALLREITDREIAVSHFDLDSAPSNTSSINCDYSSGIYQVVAHLHGLGHRRIAFVGGQPLKNINARERAYVEFMQKFGLKPGPILHGNQTVEGGFSAGLRIGRLPERPTAVIAMNDLTAIGLVKAFEQGGLRVPQDVSVVGFDRTFLAGYITPSLTTVDMHPDQIGRLAVDCLHKLSSTRNARGERHLIALDLVVGDSTGPAPAHPREEGPPSIRLASAA
jgi:LacI family transcriptional regulator